MYYVGQNVSVTFEEGGKDVKRLGILLGKSMTSPADSNEPPAIWYLVLVNDLDGSDSNPTVYLFSEQALGYVYDKEGKVRFGKTKTNTVCVLTERKDVMQVKDAHRSELARLNSDELLELNEAEV